MHHSGDQRYENGMRATTAAGAVWRKAGASNPNGECVELAGLPDGQVAVRNSRFPGGPALVYTRAEIAAFIRGAKDGDFDDLAG
ncbi:hypothetical protein SRB5_40240 [Streptomyces sp. RB5]|uniref:DUF397 domain-containing protein n=1 Tax=Streptomyces smaragdinus TaxID=2585196 RepID=A0A7K0CK60_9ACTN|nr:DUF397 domain-containing protein [Streptomyces smaragdinus]MQY13868.1 hypothetical protein [Streptomyces smaragdinus]